jgi:hypothetical protein
MENVTALNIGRPAGQGRRHYQHLIDENLEAEENMENEIMLIYLGSISKQQSNTG